MLYQLLDLLYVRPTDHDIETSLLMALLVMIRAMFCIILAKAPTFRPGFPKERCNGIMKVLMYCDSHMMFKKTSVVTFATVAPHNCGFMHYTVAKQRNSDRHRSLLQQDQRRRN
jgi:hypothetical protein